MKKFTIIASLFLSTSVFANHQINMARGVIHYKKAGCSGGGCEIIIRGCVVSENLDPAVGGTKSNTSVRCSVPMYSVGYDMPELSPGRIITPGKHEIQSSEDGGGICEIVPRSGSREMKYSNNWTSDAWYTAENIAGVENYFYNLNVAIECRDAAQ